MPRKKIIGWCTVEDCERPLKNKGLCQYHYNKKRLEENPKKGYAGLRGHPFYHLWYERKQLGLLCWEWSHFPYFVEGISPKPDGEFVLVRLVESKPFGPDNFKWSEHLRRKPNETNSEWWARKLEHRKQVNPNLESDRNIKRKFGLTRTQYDEKLKAQNFVCAICKKPETSIDHRTNTLKRFAVDHCHKAEKLGILKLRDLLCWRCNGVLGKADDSMELFQEFINYLIKHKEA